VYIQKVAAAALGSYESDEEPDFLKAVNQIYRQRRDVLVKTLCEIGYKCEKPKATFYVWVNCKGESMAFATKLLDVGVAVTPGAGFGRFGEGYVRMALTQPVERIKEACNRIASVFQ
jgi:LL-diaminopimelate aminotransferase